MSKLYGYIASPYVTRVLIFAKIKGIALSLSEPPGGNLKSPEYLKLNPIGKVPMLEVSGQGIPESSVICDYLEEADSRKPGLPPDPLGRAKSRLVAQIVDTHLAPALGVFSLRIDPATRDQKAIEAGIADLAKVFGYLEHFMGSGPFVVDDKPTLGDCVMAPHMMLATKIVFSGFPGVADPTVGNGRLARWWTGRAGQRGHEVGPRRIFGRRRQCH